MTRVFVAIPLTPELQKQAELMTNQFSNLPVRWLEGKNLHITLIPPWEETDILQAITKLKKLEGLTQPFPITFDEIALGPEPSRARLIWASGKAPQELLDLKAVVEKVFSYQPSRQSFKLHATLGRFRPSDYNRLQFEKIAQQINWKQEVGEVVIMKSHLLPSGSDYEILEKIRV